MHEQTYYRLMSLYLKVTDFKGYLNQYSYLEISENQPIMDFIKYWLNALEGEVSKSFSYFLFKDDLNEADIRILTESIVTYNLAFKDISYNMTYVPLENPPESLKMIVQEIFPILRDEIKVKDIYYKTISEDNFTESNLKKPELHIWDKKSEVYESNIPNVLSITALYHDNPLMWPLIFHEYGHVVLLKIEEKFKGEYERLLYGLSKIGLNNNMVLGRKKLKKIASEIFADIFAINYYNLNFFFSFYFYEFLPSNINGINKMDSELREHPPSLIRMKYMVEEVKKIGLSRDEVYQKILNIEKDFVDLKNEPYSTLYISFYNKISLFLKRIVGNRKNKVDYKANSVQYSNIKQRYPIGTSLDRKYDLKSALFVDNNSNLEKNDKLSFFNIEKNNKISVIIYTGWKYLILDIIDNFYKTDNEFRESNQKIKTDGKLNNKIKLFNEDYKFLLLNLNYSIETSTIVSYYLDEYYD